MSAWSGEGSEALRLMVLPRPDGGEREREGDRAAAAPPAGATDEALVRLVARGSAPAFEELLARYRDRVFQFVLWQLEGGRDAAEELTQEVFFQLYRSAASFRHRCRFRTWLYSLVRNVCRHHRRRRRGEAGRVSWQDGEAGEPVVADARPGALERLTAAEARARVRRAVASLPPLQRAVLVLRDWEDLSYREIAEVLEVPVGTVRSRLHHARRALAAILGGGEGERHGV